MSTNNKQPRTRFPCFLLFFSLRFSRSHWKLSGVRAMKQRSRRSAIKTRPRDCFNFIFDYIVSMSTDEFIPAYIPIIGLDLFLAVYTNSGENLEIQIRTLRMHRKFEACLWVLFYETVRLSESSRNDFQRSY